MSDRPSVDPITLEVTRHAAAAVCEEMNATLVRTSYSPNIKERRDCSCALFDAGGRMVAQAENIPVHLGSMPASVQAALDRHPPATLAPGDAILLNDPYDGGAHLPDLTLVTPVFDGDQLVALTANRAHHADVGGTQAGSVAADATEIYQEGLRIPPVKLHDAGTPVQSVFDLLETNTRTPTERRGDLRAQLAANETGRRRYTDLIAREGAAALDRALEAVLDYAERRMRAAIAELPDGEYRFADTLDDDGAGTTDLPIAVALTVDGETLTVDFAGTADQTTGPLNAVRAVTASATYYAVRCVTDPSIPPNAGCYRPIAIETPAGSLLDPEPPAAVVGGNLETSQRVADVVFGAFAQAVPETVAAGSQGTMNSITFGGIDPRSDSPYAFYETQAGGFGGRAGADGMDGVHVHMSNTLNTPVEVLETAYPLRVERYGLRADSAGAGEYRGGLGVRRDISVRDHEARFSVLADRQLSQPYGLFGGEPGAPGRVVRQAPDGTTERLPGKSTHTLAPGTTVSLRTPGGGGYGDPAERARDAIARDLQSGVLSVKAAREAYGDTVVAAILTSDEVLEGKPS